MSDKARKLEDLKHESKDQARRAEQMKEEAERHKKEVDTLEQAQSTMKDGLAELESPEASSVIRELDRAKESAKKEIERIKTERERLLTENKKMTELVKNAQQRSRKVGQQLELIRSTAKGEVAQGISSITSLLSKEWGNLTTADTALSSARMKLEMLKIE